MFCETLEKNHCLGDEDSHIDMRRVFFELCQMLVTSRSVLWLVHAVESVHQLRSLCYEDSNRSRCRLAQLSGIVMSIVSLFYLFLLILEHTDHTSQFLFQTILLIGGAEKCAFGSSIAVILKSAT